MTTNVKNKKHPWAKHVKAWKQSGLTQKEYCNRHGLPAKLFSLWKNKLEKKSEPQKAPSKPTPKDSPFVPVKINTPLPSKELILTFPNGINLSGITQNNVSLVLQLAEVLK